MLCRAIDMPFMTNMKAVLHLPRKYSAFRIDREPLPPCGVSVRPAPAGLTKPGAWHGGLSLSIPAEISCHSVPTFALKVCEASMTRSRSI